MFRFALLVKFFTVLIALGQLAVFSSEADGPVSTLSPEVPSGELSRTTSYQSLPSCGQEARQTMPDRRSLKKSLSSPDTHLEGNMYLLEAEGSGYTLVSVVRGSSSCFSDRSIVAETASPPSSPVTRMARDISRLTADSGDLVTTSDFNRLVLHMGKDGAKSIRAFMEMFLFVTCADAREIGIMKSNIEYRCNEVLVSKFKWGTIPLNEVVDKKGYGRYPLAQLILRYIETPELALRRCLKDDTADLIEAKTRLVSAVEAGEDAAQAALDLIFLRRRLPDYGKCNHS